MWWGFKYAIIQCTSSFECCVASERVSNISSRLHGSLQPRSELKTLPRNFKVLATRSTDMFAEHFLFCRILATQLSFPIFISGSVKNLKKKSTNCNVSRAPNVRKQPNHNLRIYKCVAHKQSTWCVILCTFHFIAYNHKLRGFSHFLIRDASPVRTKKINKMYV